MFQEQAAVSTKGDVYSFGMTILEVSSCLLCSYYQEIEFRRVAYAPDTIRQHQEKLPGGC